MVFFLVELLWFLLITLFVMQQLHLARIWLFSISFFSLGFISSILSVISLLHLLPLSSISQFQWSSFLLFQSQTEFFFFSKISLSRSSHICVCELLFICIWFGFEFLIYVLTMFLSCDWGFFLFYFYFCEKKNLRVFLFFILFLRGLKRGEEEEFAASVFGWGNVLRECNVLR